MITENVNKSTGKILPKTMCRYCANSGYRIVGTQPTHLTGMAVPCPDCEIGLLHMDDYGFTASVVRTYKLDGTN